MSAEQICGHCSWVSDFPQRCPLCKAYEKINIAYDALIKIRSLTHSWVLAEQTIDCKHTYTEIGFEAGKAAASLEELKK